MRILRPLFLGLACEEVFRFPGAGRLARFRRGFLPSGGGAFFGLGGGGGGLSAMLTSHANTGSL